MKAITTWYTKPFISYMVLCPFCPFPALDPDHTWSSCQHDGTELSCCSCCPTKRKRKSQNKTWRENSWFQKFRDFVNPKGLSYLPAILLMPAFCTSTLYIIEVTISYGSFQCQKRDLVKDHWSQYTINVANVQVHFSQNWIEWTNQPTICGCTSKIRAKL
jgi:hypothetical protein